MSPSPVTFHLPTEPASYSWEATDDGVAERYGLPVEQVVRFDLNTSPTPPALVERLLREGRFETRLSEYPPGDYRRLVAAAAERYEATAEEVLPGAGADEILELCAKAFLGAGRAAVIPVPSYAMYRVVTEQREARVVAVPRLGPDAGWAIDEIAVRQAARTASAVWLCNPNNPTGRLEPAGAVERLLDGIVADAADDGRSPAVVIVDEAYAEFAGRTLLSLRHRYDNLVVVRTASKAYALAGLRVGFAIAAPATLARVARYRPPGSVGTISATVVAAALREPAAMRSNVERVSAERPRLTAALEAIGWRPGPSAANFVLLDLGSPDRAAAAADGLMRQGIVPRTFGADHPLAHCLRITVRAAAENDRFVAAATQVATRLDAPRPRPGAPGQDGPPADPSAGRPAGVSDTTPRTEDPS